MKHTSADEKHPPVRRVIRRGHSQNIARFPSIKMRRFIDCESPLEWAFVLRAETNPDVTAIWEQPETLIWHDGKRYRQHVPDFLIENCGRQELKEVKFSRDVERYQARTACIERDQRRMGRAYDVITEGEILAEPWFTNSNLLWNGRCCLPLPSIRRAAVARFRERHQISIGDLLDLEPAGLNSVNSVYAMILAAELRVVRRDLPLSIASMLRLDKADPQGADIDTPPAVNEPGFGSAGALSCRAASLAEEIPGGAERTSR